MEVMMEDILVATLITEGGKLLTEFIRSNRAGKQRPFEATWPVIPDELPGFSEKGAASLSPFEPGSSRLVSVTVKPSPRPLGDGTVNYAPVQSLTGEKVATSCVGCAIGHLATCVGLLKEAVRFSGEGMDSPNIIDRLNTCLDELNAMERVDLQPSKIVNLPEWEKALAHQALDASRDARHMIESGITSADQLERLAAGITNVRQEIGGRWLQQKMRALSKEDKAEIQRRVMAKLENIGEEQENAR
jgi:hypothetical protein